MKNSKLKLEIKNHTRFINCIKITLVLIFNNFISHSQGIPPPVGADANYEQHNVIITVPEVALLYLEAANGTTVTLNPSVPTEAGLALTFHVVNSTMWLNYSSVIGSISEPSRNITAQITSGAVPAGTSLKVGLGADVGTGDGLMGLPTAPITLSNISQNVIVGIGSAYTGGGINKGHNLQYTLDILPDAGAYGLLDFNFNEVLVVTYTLTDI